MRIFTRFRKSLSDNSELKTEIADIKKAIHNNTQNIELVFQYLDELVEKKEETKIRKRIGYVPDDI